MTYNRLLEEAQWKEGVFYKVQLLNAWRTSPVLGAPVMLAAFQEHGVPVFLRTQGLSPPGTDPESFLYTRRLTEGQDTEAGAILRGIQLFDGIAEMYGLPQLPVGDDNEKFMQYLKELAGAADRYMERQWPGPQRMAGH